MLLEGTNRQIKMEFVCIEDLVPKDHILRKIDKYINFSFINDLCRPYYCENNGRPAIEPEIMFKMLFIGYLFGIRSETRLVEDVKVNIAYRWFLGYGITKIKIVIIVLMKKSVLCLQSNVYVYLIIK